MCKSREQGGERISNQSNQPDISDTISAFAADLATQGKDKADARERALAGLKALCYAELCSRRCSRSTTRSGPAESTLWIRLGRAPGHLLGEEHSNQGGEVLTPQAQATVAPRQHASQRKGAACSNQNQPAAGAPSAAYHAESAAAAVVPSMSCHIIPCQVMSCRVP